MYESVARCDAEREIEVNFVHNLEMTMRKKMHSRKVKSMKPSKTSMDMPAMAKRGMGPQMQKSAKKAMRDMPKVTLSDRKRYA